MTLSGTTPGEALGPVARRERIHLLDVLRGFALGGILLANIQVLSGMIFQPGGTPEWTETDRLAVFLVHVLIDEKFYSIFSLLFGIGFSILMGRTANRGAAFASFFRRRLTILLGIGLVHALLIWPGDILVLYAVLGFVLLLFRNCSQRAILAWSAAILASPVLVYLGFLAIGIPDYLASPPRMDGGSNVVELIFDAFRSGGYGEVVRANVFMYVGHWIRYFVNIRIPKVLGMFLFGVWLDRRGVFRDVERHKGLLRATALAGLVIGLPGNIAVATLAERGVFLPPSRLGLLQISMAVVAVPALALGYASTLALLWRGTAGRALTFLLAPAGRMALTTYLTQSVVGIAVFYGLGLGLYGRLEPLEIYGIALAIFAAQLVVSRIWMSVFAYGPVEWLWRRLTYRRPLNLRRSRAAGATRN